MLPQELERDLMASAIPMMPDPSLLWLARSLAASEMSTSDSHAAIMAASDLAPATPISL